MKKIYTIATLLMLFLSVNLFAQDVLVVDPGVGTLNDAIETHGADKIYQLQAGQFYQIDGVIENAGYHLQIIGEEATGDGMPATLQSGQTPDGAAFGTMFDAKGDLTLKNIYIMNVDLTGQMGGVFITQTADESRTVVDNCIIDPVALVGNVFNGASQKIYWTNNLCIRHGHQLNPNDGHFFITHGVERVGLDTMLVENNTFVSMGTNMWEGGFNAHVHNFVWWNHNTFVNTKSQIDWSIFENEYFWTNNLMFNQNTQPWAVPWGAMPGHDAGYLLPSLIYADTLTDETLPSERIQFVQYNAHYRNQGFYDLVEEINNLEDNNTINDVYLMPLVWPVDSSGSREAELFANDETFPNWKTGNYILDVDPQFVDQEIYTTADAFVEWTRPATYVHALGFASDGQLPEGTPIPPANQWPQWHWDPDGDPAINSAWPVFDGTYTNAELLTGSIEGLPLGDLNWFPADKAVWGQNKETIMDHMMALNTDQLTLERSVTNIEFNSLNVYPNPTKDYLRISSENAIGLVRIYSIAGVLQFEDDLKNSISHSLNTKDLSSGLYIIKAESSNGKTYVNKFIKK
ncbi:MAG: T9SS type A sorting domain-containing protein [Bacteroidales bacterium]|nr:T9SS type A sorting domain-containing protein [Bacteroidales bacterium]